MTGQATTERAPGRIITFYSYKGGTGRSMALANVAWILAASGRRVLMIDWDFEAPGLHRYVHPFLEDKELVSTPGLIDFFVDFAASARIAKASTITDERWFESQASVLRYAVPVESDFGKGSLDLVPAGRQDAAYPVRTNAFDWKEFYETLGGGIFLEAVKRQLRKNYEFILIDSRTGLNDTAGICTVQMPDELVVLFTFNQQSIKGAYAIAESAEQQRRKPTGEPALRIWPVATRVELAEKERLEAARDVARATFQRFIKHLPRTERSDYWGRTEVMYQPYYAYEEVLATFADRPGTGNSMLASMERLTECLAGMPVSFRIPEFARRDLLAQYQRVSGKTLPTQSLVYVSYTPADRNLQIVCDELRRLLDKSGLEIWPPIRLTTEHAEDALARSSLVVVLVGKDLSMAQQREMVIAREAEKMILPVMVGSVPSIPFVGRVAPTLRVPSGVSFGAVDVANAVRRILNTGTLNLDGDPDDLNKGRFGGRSETNGRELTATVQALSDQWFRVILTVHGLSDGEVAFHLDPATFPNPVRTVQATDGNASYEFQTWGAFTVGAIMDEGRTALELDLATLSDAPQTFRDR